MDIEKATTKSLIKRGYEIDKAITVTEDVSYGELAEFDAIIHELNKRGIITDETIKDIESGEIGTFDMYIDSDLNTCYRCNKVETDIKVEEFICNVYDDYTYCEKCCAIVSKEFEELGYTYNIETDEVKAPVIDDIFTNN